MVLAIPAFAVTEINQGLYDTLQDVYGSNVLYVPFFDMLDNTVHSIGDKMSRTYYFSGRFVDTITTNYWYNGSNFDIGTYYNAFSSGAGNLTTGERWHSAIMSVYIDENVYSQQFDNNFYFQVQFGRMSGTNGSVEYLLYADGTHIGRLVYKMSGQWENLVLDKTNSWYEINGTRYTANQGTFALQMYVYTNNWNTESALPLFKFVTTNTIITDMSTVIEVLENVPSGGYTEQDIQNAFNSGYNDGMQQASLVDLVTALFRAPMELVDSVLDFNIFGINMAASVRVLITMAIIGVIAFVVWKAVK